jgi:hypothetical protein
MPLRLLLSFRILLVSPGCWDRQAGDFFARSGGQGFRLLAGETDESNAIQIHDLFLRFE